MKRCAICGFDLKDDLFSAVTGEPCCSICKTKFIGGLPTTEDRIVLVRARLGLMPGQFLKQDRAEEASTLLSHHLMVRRPR